LTQSRMGGRRKPAWALDGGGRATVEWLTERAWNGQWGRSVAVVGPLPWGSRGCRIAKDGDPVNDHRCLRLPCNRLWQTRPIVDVELHEFPWTYPLTVGAVHTKGSSGALRAGLCAEAPHLSRTVSVLDRASPRRWLSCDRCAGPRCRNGGHPNSPMRRQFGTRNDSRFMLRCWRRA
jgi:hypothetical protein